MARLGDILVKHGWITEGQVQSALSAQGTERGLLGTILVRRGLITSEQLGQGLAEQYGVPFMEVVPEGINPQVVRLIPEDLARQHKVVPVGVSGRSLQLAMVAPDEMDVISETELITGYKVVPLVALQGAIEGALDRGFDDRVVARQTIVDMKMADLVAAESMIDDELTAEVVVDDDQTPVVRLVRAILMGAINAGSSDIHLEPHHPEMRVRYRVDGQLQAVMTIPRHIEESVVARIKVMADMDTTENRRPQDGQLSINEPTGRVNFRVSTIPTVGGEKVVMRLLDEGSRIFQLDQLGLCDRDLKKIQTLIDKPHGMIVVTGPTGSGKSTTMYALLSKLNAVSRNIVTVEDPVEYRLPGINQVASDNEHGLGFANALKYIMRQDPDVIMLGEIRDHETASTAVQAALTGHLLISTLHTNDAVGAVARLNDLGIDSFKTGGALLGSIAQRLLRSICNYCKEPVTPNAHYIGALRHNLRIPTDAVFFAGRGCKKCLGTGYSGRIPIYEIMVVTPTLAQAIEKGLPTSKLREIALQEGLVELATAGLEQVLAGQTTVEEVFYKVSGQQITAMSRQKRIAVGAAVVGEARPSFDLGAWWQTLTAKDKKTDRLKQHELTFILRTLATLVNNGVSLPKALGTLAREDTLAKHQHLLEALRRKVEAGVSFSSALGQFPQVCDQITVSQIRLGERSGTLADTLQHLSENRGKSAELKQAVIKKLAYPCLLITIGSGLLTFLLMYVVPVFEETYSKAKVPLPLITRMLIQFSVIVQTFGPYILGGLILVAIVVTQLRKREEFAVVMDRNLLRTPVIGTWIRDMAVLQLMEVLHSLMAAGYNLAEAVRETAQSVSNRAVRQGVRDLQVAINRGERFSRELERHEDMFPPIVNQLVIVGESTGQLTRATKDICDYLRHEIERKTSLLVGALEPILTIGLASAIAVVLLAIYLPMFDMVNTIK